MKALLLAFLLWQAIPQREGVVTGVVRGANGMPAAGVRVYAIGVREGLTVLDSAAPLEGLTQTDASGRYRLEISPGRYYIASGAVTSPTFYPGARDIAGARVVTVASGGFVEAVDFSSFVPAPAAGVSTVVAQGTGVLSGTIRFPDGSPATGIPLSIVPASVLLGRLAQAAPVQVQPAPVSGNIVLQFLSGNTPNAPPAPPQTVLYFQSQSLYQALSIVRRTSIFSDGAGRYVLSSLPSDTYYIAAGYAESPTLFPGVTDIALAKTVVTTPTTNMSSLDFTLPRPPASVKVSGRVTAIAGAPAGGTSVELRTTSSSPSVYGLPSRTPMVRAIAGPDGSFEFPGVFPGTYILEAFIAGVRAESRNVVVSDQPLTGFELTIRLAVLSGRIVAEDGSTLPDPRVFADVIVSSAGNPNILRRRSCPSAGMARSAAFLNPANTGSICGPYRRSTPSSRYLPVAQTL